MKECIENSVEEIAATSISSFYDYYNNFNSSITQSNNWFSNLSLVFDSLKDMLSGIMNFVMEKLNNILFGSSTIINSFKNILTKLNLRK